MQPLLHPIRAPDSRFVNWGRTFACAPLAVFEPENVHHCQLVLELARREGKVVRPVGVGHSPSDLSCTSGYMLRTTKLNRLLEVRRSSRHAPSTLHTHRTQVDVDKRYVVAEAGITLDALHAELAKHGLAMINVGSISDQTLGGIITTATHGTGINYGVISTHVIALSLLLADGTRVSCSRQERPDLFIASICGLGSTGLILSVTLQVEPAFRLRETQQSLTFHECIRKMDALVPASQHVRVWWYPAADTMRVFSADRTVEVSSPFRHPHPHPQHRPFLSICPLESRSASQGT